MFGLTKEQHEKEMLYHKQYHLERIGINFTSDFDVYKNEIIESIEECRLSDKPYNTLHKDTLLILDKDEYFSNLPKGIPYFFQLMPLIIYYDKENDWYDYVKTQTIFYYDKETISNILLELSKNNHIFLYHQRRKNPETKLYSLRFGFVDKNGETATHVSSIENYIRQMNKNHERNKI